MNLSQGTPPKITSKKDEVDLLIQRIVNELPLTCKDNEWLCVEEEIINIGSFRVKLLRYAKSFHKKFGEKKEFTCNIVKDNIYKIYRTL